MTSSVDAAFARLLDGECDAEETKSFLVDSIDKMTDPNWIVAGAKAMRARMIAIDAPEGAIDVCGTGGDGAQTLNISTAVALAAAGCGVSVAKHGNRAMSSKCGAADVLEALGVTLTGDKTTLETCLREAGVAFLFAQNHHPAMRHVAAARREIGKRTIFNILGPLSNPAGVKRQLLGVFSAELMQPIAEALRRLEAETSWVVHGHGDVDEISLSGQSNVIASAKGEVRSFALSPEDFGLPAPIALSELAGGDAKYNADALQLLLSSPAKANQAYLVTVAANTAAALVVAGQAQNVEDGFARARAALDSGAALRALQRLIDLSKSAP